MQSVFDLTTDTESLMYAKQGISKMTYDQQAPTRSVVGSNFSNGAINFRFQSDGTKWWLPSRSYMRTRFKIGSGDGTNALVAANGIAPNMGLMASLFQSGEFRVNGKTVSRIPDFMSYVDALETRLNKSSSWMDTLGGSTNWFQADQKDRLQEVSSDGVFAPDVSTVAVDGDIGFDPGTTTVQFTAVGSVITFAGGGDTTVFQAGDIFRITTGNGVLVAGDYEVSAILTAATMSIIAPAIVDVGPSAAVRFSRVRKFSSKPARGVSEFELTWVPPLSIFKVPHGLPAGSYELVLTPHSESSYQKRAIESVLGVASKNPTLTGGAAQDFKLSVVDMYLYNAVIEGPRVDNLTYLLELEQTRCQTDKIDGASLSQKNFEVSPATYALTVAYADLRAGENTTVSCSKFKAYNAALTAAQELQLNRMFVQYAGVSFPSPDADPSFDVTKDYTTQRYVESQLNSNAYFDSGGAEDIQDFHKRGAYYHFKTPRDGTDRSTRVKVNSQFNIPVPADVANLRVLLFDHSRQICRIQIQDGRIIDVQIEEA